MKFIEKEIVQLYKKCDYEKSLDKAKSLLQTAKQKNSKKFRAIANYYIGLNLFELQEYSRVEPYLTKAISYFEKNDKNITAKARNQLAIIYEKSSKHYEAIELFEKNVEYYMMAQNTKKAVSTMVSIALEYDLAGDFEFAVSKYHECLEILKTLKYTYAEAMIHNNLGETYLNQKNLEKAKEHISKAIQISEENNHLNVLVRALDCYAGICFFTNKMEEALKWEQKAVNILKEESDRSLFCNITMNMSSIYQSMNKYEKALEVLNSIYEDLVKLNDAQKWLKYYQGKSEILIQMGNYKKALEYKDKFIEVHFQQFDKERFKLIEENRIKTEKLMSEIKDLEKENELIQLRAKKELQDKELTYKALQIVQKNELIGSIMSSLETLQTKNPRNVKIINEILELISIDSASQSVWEEFEKWFTKVNTDFFTHLLETVPNITNRYRQLAALIKLGLRSKEIALLMGISAKSVEKYRVRFRKKLNLNRGESLASFIEKL